MNAEQLSVALDALHHTPRRREPREETVRIVEYTPFPRVGPDAGPRIGFTRDVSQRGLCIGVDDPAPVGAMLRVTLRELNGRPGRPCVDRVVWCARARDGRYWLGLEHLTEPGRS
jgi:hypothetical protein